MKAIVYTQYGPPDVLQLREVERPEPSKDAEAIRYLAEEHVKGKAVITVGNHSN